MTPVQYKSVELAPLVQGVLDGVALCSMSTVNQDGTAHINTAFFCVDSLWRLFFVSRTDAQHSKNLVERPNMAVSVFDTCQEWDDWKTGLQLFGRCAIASESDARQAAELYKQRFPDYSKWLHSLGRALRSKLVPPFFMFLPDRVKILSEDELGEEEFVTIKLSRA